MDTVASIQNGTVRSTGKAGPINCTATVRIRKSGGEKQSFHKKACLTVSNCNFTEDYAGCLRPTPSRQPFSLNRTVPMIDDDYMFKCGVWGVGVAGFKKHALQI